MPKDFEFDLHARRWQYTKVEAIAELQRVASRENEPLNGARYKAARPRISLDTVQRMFGSFEQACREAGISLEGIKKVDISDSDLIDHFETLVKFRHGVPSANDFTKYRLKNGRGIHYSTFVRRFGSYRKFLVNYDDYHKDRISMAELIARSKPNPRPRISPAVRAEVIRRHDSTCHFCGRKAPEVALDIDHIVPRSRGGADDISNYTLKCRDCNLGKGARFEG